jgi:hypothetical protein
LPSDIGEYRLIRSDGAEIGRVVVRVSRHAEARE